MGEAVLSAGPKCKAGLFPDVQRLGGGWHVPECPRVPGALGAPTRAHQRAALTMEHGLREVAVVMMTGTAAGAGSHHP